MPALGVGEHARVGKYVAMGTSLSMGVMSNGVVGADQAQSWPAQLAALAGVPFSQPLIQAPGCQPPLAVAARDASTREWRIPVRPQQRLRATRGGNRHADAEPGHF